LLEQIPEKHALGLDPMGENRFSEKDTLTITDGTFTDDISTTCGLIEALKQIELAWGYDAEFRN
jgi:hypothetical protein